MKIKSLAVGVALAGLVGSSNVMADEPFTLVVNTCNAIAIVDANNIDEEYTSCRVNLNITTPNNQSGDLDMTAEGIKMCLTLEDLCKFDVWPYEIDVLVNIPTFAVGIEEVRVDYLVATHHRP